MKIFKEGITNGQKLFVVAVILIAVAVLVFVLPKILDFV